MAVGVSQVIGIIASIAKIATGGREPVNYAVREAILKAENYIGKELPPAWEFWAAYKGAIKGAYESYFGGVTYHMNYAREVLGKLQEYLQDQVDAYEDAIREREQRRAEAIKDITFRIILVNSIPELTSIRNDILTNPYLTFDDRANLFAIAENKLQEMIKVGVVTPEEVAQTGISFGGLGEELPLLELGILAVGIIILIFVFLRMRR